MTTEDAPKGIFAKMVRFVKNPATNWSDLDESGGDRNSNSSKVALKEMIERKRRNDFVRKREFDMLRKIRRREAEVGVGNANDIVRPSFFQSSMPSKPDDRANTLKKIDEIEAQMSMQWWKTKNGTAPGDMRGNGFGGSRPVDSSPASGAAGQVAASNFSYAPTAPAKVDGMGQVAPTPAPPTAPVISSGANPPMAAPRAPRMPASDGVSAPNLAGVSAPGVVTPTAAQRAAGVLPQSGKAAAPMGAGVAGTSAQFSSTKMFAMEVDEVTHDPELEEAAIRFANGDAAGAEAGLLEVLGNNGTRANHLETWLTLFDLYRATGQFDRYETAALDFVGRFHRSAPQWFSMPDIVGKMGGVHTRGVAAADSKKADWVCPSIVGLQSVAALNAAVARLAAPWRLNWRNLKSVEANAVEPLTRLLQTWADTSAVQLHFMGETVLLKALQDATPSGVPTVEANLWQLRLTIMRLMHRPDEFEMAALDYCVTYEVSPPSWEAAKSAYKTLDEYGAGSSPTIVGDAVLNTFGGELGNSTLPVLVGEAGASTVPRTQVSSVELAGSVEGDATVALDKLEARLSGADVCVISCARLIRVDFSAAGAVLNWVSARQAEGRTVSFVDVHRLVSAFFDVIGISDIAKVIHRRD